MAKKGGSLLEGLWIGTGVFAAANSTTYVSFLGHFFLYALFLAAVTYAVVWVLKTFGVEKFEQFSYPPCPAIIDAPTGEGDKKCVTPSGDVRIY